MSGATGLPQEFLVLPLVQPDPDRNPIPKSEIRKLTDSGLSECPVEDRCLTWLVLLGIYPDNPFEWSDARLKYSETYQASVNENGLAQWHTQYIPYKIDRNFLRVPDQVLMGLIHTDVVRTGRHIFFLPPGEPLEGAPDSIDGLYSAHMRRIERILYIFARLHPDLSYKQGFNELSVPLYYVNHAAIGYFGGDIDEVEALSFFAFERLIIQTEIRHFYSVSGETDSLDHKVNEFMELLKIHLPEMHRVLLDLEIEPYHFAVPWFNLLFAQKYQLPVILMIWDTLFAHFDEIMKYVGYIAIAHLELIQDQISTTDFAETMVLLQEVKAPNVLAALRRAHALYRADHEPPPPSVRVSLFQSIQRKFRP
jgi:hypothetical protein